MALELDETLPKRIAERLAEPLPGPTEQARFAPDLSYGRHRMPPLPDTRQAAVLLLLYYSQEHWHVPLIVRPQGMSTHAGQVSFPGGEMEGTETHEQAALREFEEELGTPPNPFAILGRMTPLLVYASNFCVTPCVAAILGRPAFQPSPAEVDAVLEPRLGDLAQPQNHGSHCIRRQGVEFRAPHIRCEGHRIWGATAMILSEFFAVLAEADSHRTGSG
jgi:8-oxo-dGTP pyrophosphatase MutT (NUDIX family)